MAAGGEVATEQRQRLTPQRLGVQRLLLPGLVPRADHQAQGLAEQVLALDFRQVLAGKGNAQVQAIFGQGRLQAILGHFLDAQADARIALVEAAEQGPGQVSGEGRGQGQAQRAAAQVLHVMHGSPGGLQVLQGTPGIGDIGLAGIGQAHAAPGTVEQRRSQGLLQLLDLLRQGRLRHVQRLGGAGEVAVLGNGQQVTDMTQEHDGSNYRHDLWKA